MAPEYADPPRERVTLTLPLLEDARLVLFLVAGAAKRDAVREALGPDATMPAGRVRAVGRTLWMVDAPAIGTAGDAGR